MIIWQFVDVTEPPLTKHIATQDLMEHIQDGNKIKDVILYDLPTNTQSVERSVKEVTNASKRVCSASRRDGVIRTTLFDRKIRPKFNTKKEFLGST